MKKLAWNNIKNLRSWHLVSSLHGKWKGRKWKQWQLFFFKFLNWRIIALQNFVVFCYTSTRISRGYTRVPSLLHVPPISVLIPPFSLSQSPCLGSLSHIANSHWLSILHMVMWVCMLLCTSHPLLPSPHVHKSVLYVCFSIADLKINSSVPSLQIPFICVSIRYFGEGNGNSLQYSCLENPVDRGTWWAAGHGVSSKSLIVSGLTF